MMYGMRRRKSEPTLLSILPPTPHRLGMRGTLMMLYVIHSGEMDFSTATCYDSDGMHSSVPSVTNPAS